MAPENLPSMRISLVLRASIVAVALVGWAATPALAAPQMISSDPEEGAVLHQPPSRVRITVSEPLTGESNIKVIDDCGVVVSVGDAEVGGAASNELSIAVGKAPHHGTYLVKWYGTGVTGAGSGQFTFTVHAGAGCSGGGGGGHGGHGGSGGGSGGGGHGGGSGGGSGGSGGHSGGHSGGGSGSGSGHSSGHSGSDDDHSTMSGGDHSGGGDHKMGGKHRGGHSKKNNKHGNHNKGKDRHQGHETGNGDDVLAGGPAGPISDIPTGTTVAIALGLAVLMGAAGGWVLRISTPR